MARSAPHLHAERGDEQPEHGGIVPPPVDPALAADVPRVDPEHDEAEHRDLHAREVEHADPPERLAHERQRRPDDDEGREQQEDDAHQRLGG